jgi:hypothetical protein
MISFSPRVWGYQDYSKEIKAKVPPQTMQERQKAVIISVPFMIFIFGYPIYSLLILKSQLGGDISFFPAFIHLLVLFLFGTFGDLVILDWFIISKVTPSFVIIPGTIKDDYKDFSHHYRGHALASIPLIIICAAISAVVSYL